MRRPDVEQLAKTLRRRADKDGYISVPASWDDWRYEIGKQLDSLSHKVWQWRDDLWRGYMAGLDHNDGQYKAAQIDYDWATAVLDELRAEHDHVMDYMREPDEVRRREHVYNSWHSQL